MQRMAVERLEYKTRWIEQLFESFHGDYSQTFYTVLLRNFGFKTNALPFEILSKHLTANVLLKHADNQFQVEALLFGTAGMLDEQFEDRYILKLQNEYSYLKNKYQLIPLNKELFKFSRLRPANFPTLRLAQFARLVHSKTRLFFSPYSLSNVEQIKNALKIEPEGYWKNHYRLEGEATNSDLSFGKNSIENILINTFATFLFFYARKTGLAEYEDLSLGILESCGFESNAKTKLFTAKKQSLKSAADSQGAVHLHDNYCTKRKCLSCGIAADVLK